MNTIYCKKNYKIYKIKNGAFIVHNTKKDFKTGHTHINNYNTAKYIIDMSIHNLIPNRHLSKYLLGSIIRISDDESYIEKIKEIMG